MFRDMAKIFLDRYNKNFCSGINFTLTNAYFISSSAT
jgi:hypothetical protein